MTALIVIAAILAFFVVLALLRFGASFEYSPNGLRLVCILGPVRIRLIPKKDRKKPKKPEKNKNSGKKTRKTKGEKQEISAEKHEKPGTIAAIKAVLPTVLKAAGRFFKHLRIDELTVRFTITGDDPCDTALYYGYASAGMGYLLPALKTNFKIKKLNVSVFPSFTDTDETVYIKVRATIALWEIVYIIAKLDFKAILSIL